MISYRVFESFREFAETAERSNSIFYKTQDLALRISCLNLILPEQANIKYKKTLERYKSHWKIPGILPWIFLWDSYLSSGILIQSFQQVQVKFFIISIIKFESFNFNSPIPIQIQLLPKRRRREVQLKSFSSPIQIIHHFNSRGGFLRLSKEFELKLLSYFEKNFVNIWSAFWKEN